MGQEFAKTAQGGKNPIILVVDDDFIARLQIRDILENEGMTVVEAATGLSALDYFRNNPVDLVLLDVVMPGIDGFMTCREIRSLPDGVHVPVVMVTGLDDAESITEAFSAGATDFVCKPLNLLILGYRVRYWLRSGAALRALQVNQMRLFKAQEIAGIGHWEKNLDSGDFQLTCRRTAIFGLSHPCTYDSLFAPILSEDVAEARRLIDDACRDGIGFRVQYRINLPGKGVRIILNQGEVLRKSATQNMYAVGILQDITDRQIPDESLSGSVNAWRTVFERSPVGIALIDNESKFINCNQHFKELLGISREHCVGINLLDILPPGKMQQYVLQALSGEGGHHFVGLPSTLVGGKDVSLYIVCERVAPDHFVVALVDFTEQRQAILAQDKMQA